MRRGEFKELISINIPISPLNIHDIPGTKEDVNFDIFLKSNALQDLYR